MPQAQFLERIMQSGHRIGFDRRVLEEIDPAALARGLSYHRQGRVRDILVEADGMGLLAAVQGSEPEPYEVDITVARNRRHSYNVEGFCTCPVSYNCKHVAAALYAVLMGDAPRATVTPAGVVRTQPARTLPPAIPPTDEGALTAWLSNLSRFLLVDPRLSV